jgi:OmcA/MtrC family decaheme c-type cytochrome
MFTLRTSRAAAFGSIALTLILSGAVTRPYARNQKAFYADPRVVAFVRPGLTIKITSAAIAQDGTITVNYSLTDPQGLPLDRTGVQTPGAISTTFIAAYIPAGQTQYADYVTRTQTGAISGTVTQAAGENNGVLTVVGDAYRYTFTTKAPAGFNAATTHTIGIYGSRNLTEFDLGTNYASATFNFVPNGSAVSVTRDVIRTQSCNRCHDQLASHGGSRRGLEMCILCHSPQTSDPDTGNTVDFPVMVHKIHMGANLPSVVAGKPYQIIGNNQSVNDYSTVVDPADVRRCEVCHAQDTGAAQASAYLTKPTRVACGSCHDDVNFGTGANHAGGPQVSDNLCANCHIPQGETEFDASVKGAHVVETESSLLSGMVITITKVSNGTAGSAPVVAFTLKDATGNPLPLSKVEVFYFTLAGPTSDFGNTNFGLGPNDVATPGYIQESPLFGGTCDASGSCLYTFRHTVPATAKGTFVIGSEARRTETVLAGTTKERSITYGAKNQVVTFSVDGSNVEPRRTVVDTASCNKCHVSLSLHGTLRNQTEYCVVCHNPKNTDIVYRQSSDVPADRTQPPQGVNFNLLVHRIHTGENLPPDRPYIVVGYPGHHNDFSHVRYPAFSAQGSPGDTRNCAKCHVNGSELNLPAGLSPVTDPQGPLSPVQPITSACTGCHVSNATLSHAVSNTTQIGESCAVCHESGSAFAVDKVHAQY